VRNTKVWWIWLAGGTAATGGYYLIRDNDLAANLAYNAIGLVSALMILVAIRMHRPQRPGIWYWFAAGQLLWVIGDVVYEYYRYVLHEEPYPSFADVFYLCAYPMLVIGLLGLIRNRRGRDLTGLVDAAIVSTGLGLIFWVFVLHPIAAETAASWIERTISTAYPAMDALLLVMLTRVLTSGARRTPSIRLLGAAALLLLVADVSFSLVTLYSDGENAALDSLWLMSYVIWAAAALHPSMRSPGDAPVSSPRMTRRRLLLLAASSVLAPATLFVPGIADDLPAVAIGALVLFLLVVLRMSGFVAQVQRQSDQLEDLAMRDDLTGLANRRQFALRVREALSGSRPQVLLLDLDGFKEVNDDLGHSVGDRLLVVLSQRLTQAMPAGALVARMGGDEFAVLLRDGTDADALAVVDLLTGTLREPIMAGTHELLVAASIGSTDGAGTDDPFEMLRRADVAMYAAKRHGDRHRRYDVGLDEQAGTQARIGAELRTALDAGQFRLVYQPIVELPHGRIVGVETLVRWAHPERGVVGPADFIEIAEQNGLIIELGTWILRAACRQAAEWRADLGPHAPGKISVNVSARQLAQRGFAALVAGVLAETGLPADRLTVEVTETAVFESGQALTALHELHALGVRVALDDFGTGHSSLTLLQTVPADVLKVDKSFVDNITMSGRHAVIATALITIGQGLGLDVVAEGVETAEQADELYRLGYRLAQGYHFGKPSAEPDFLGITFPGGTGPGLPAVVGRVRGQ
jgi:diguanylate cyclase (GGDEF)-like protein